MEKSLELIKRLKEELEELKHNFETVYINNTNNINEIEKEENEIKKIEKRIDEKERKQLIIIIKKTAIFVVSMVIVGSLLPPAVGAPIVTTMTILTISIFLLTVIPKTEKMIHNFILKLSPKLKQLEDEINTLKEALSIKRRNKQELELIKQELKSELNKAELSMKDKETELREAEEIYLNNIFNTDNTTIIRNEPHKNIVKVRVKQKNNIQ